MDQTTERRIDRHLRRYAKVWGLPGFEKRVTVEFSARMRTSLGRCLPNRYTVRIAAWLREAAAGLFEEVLCHEAAHAAVFALHGHRVKPHGPQWQALVRSAGFEPRVRLPHALLPPAQQRRIANGSRYEHRCPVCQASRLARRAMHGWRCARCHHAGLPGRLVITSRPEAPSRAVEAT